MPWTAAHQTSLSITNSQSIHKPMTIESVMTSNYLILCLPLLLPHPNFPSIRVFSDKSVCRITWPKYWSFNFRSSPSNEYWGKISFRIDWLDLLEVQGTLKSLLQHHSRKVSILQCSGFFTVQLPHSYTTIGKTIALTRRTFIGKVTSLLFNILSRLVNSHSSKEQVSFNFMAALTNYSDFQAPQNKVCPFVHLFPIYLPWSDAGRDWGQEEKGWQRMRWLDGIIDSMDVGLGEFQELVLDSKAWHAAIHGVAKSQTRLSDFTSLSDMQITPPL